MSAVTMGTVVSLGGPDGTSVVPIGLGSGHRFGNELTAVALVDSCLAIGIDLTLIYDTGNINTLQRVEYGCCVTSSASVPWWSSSRCLSLSMTAFWWRMD